MAHVLTGLEVFLRDGVSELRGKRAGLIANPTAIDRNFVSTIDRLKASPMIELRALFGPEHGVRGDAQAGIDVVTVVDARTGLPVYSLYGNTRRPSAAMLSELDVLFFDMQDFGVRYATYLSTLLLALETCAEAQVRFVIFDRPNPLGGAIEGALLDPAFASFVGAADLPVRHGMTLGELALMLAAERGLPAPSIVPMRGWQREMWYDQTGLPWVPPSPNAPTLDTLTVYGGTCLIEGTNLSEGRGTTRPFEIVGAPWIDPFALAATLTERALPGVAFRPTYFMPTFQKHANTTCGGVQLHITDRTTFRPVATGLHVLHAVRQLSGEAFGWIEGSNGFFVDLLLGSSQPRIALETGSTPDDFIAAWSADEQAFAQRRAPFLLYDERGDDHMSKGTSL